MKKKNYQNTNSSDIKKPTTKIIIKNYIKISQIKIIGYFIDNINIIIAKKLKKYSIQLPLSIK